MKLVMTLLVRDEEDILRTHLDFHRAQGVDFFLIMDHHSRDATRLIAEEYERMGMASVLSQSDPGYHQAEWVTAMARTAATDYGADWVINSDADEFWWPVEGSLRSTLEAVEPGYGVLSVARHNFRPVSDESGPFVDRMVFRDVVSTNSRGEPLPPKACHRAGPDVMVAQGNHTVTGGGASRDAQELTILHYPMRTYGQFARKIAQGGRAYQLSDGLPPELGATWRSLYDLYQNDGLRAFYETELLTEDRIQRDLVGGRIVRDDRLSTFISDMEGDRPPGRFGG